MAELPDRTLIKQPVSQDLRVQPGTLQATERYKGRFEHCQNVAGYLYSTTTVTRTDFLTHAGTLSAFYDIADPPTGLEWVLGEATVDECDAGENGILQIIWNAGTTSYDPPSAQVPDATYWNLKWVAENYDVYAYCKNPDTHQTQGGSPGGGGQGGSQRVAIEQCLHPPTGNNVMTTHQLFSNNQGNVLKLNPNEKKILNWKLEGKYVIKHHPVITQTSIWNNKNGDQVDALITSQTTKLPDVIDTPAQTFQLQGYTWVSQGSNFQVSQADIKKKTFTVQRNTDWIGALSVVTEFYGPSGTAWTFGDM